MKREMMVLLLVLLLIPSLPVMAQERQNTISYGETVSGEITDREYEIPYTFTGSEGDTIVIEMKAVDTFGDLAWPAILLLGENSRLGSSIDYDEVTFVLQLPDDGEYTILATREGGRTGDSVGEFTLSLFKPPMMPLNEAVEDTIIRGEKKFYVVEASDAFNLAYNKVGGGFNPSISVNRLNEGEVEEVTVLQGELLTKAVITLEPQSATAAGLYVVIVQEALFDWDFEDTQATYSLTLSQ